MLMVDSEKNSDLRAAAGSSTLRFSKMHALGNDFVVVSEDALNQACAALTAGSKAQISDKFLQALAEKLCSRRFGIGADGFIVVRRGSRPENLSWTYLNSDGSVSLMCGNGLRCLALWAHANNWAKAKTYFVETGKGPVQITFESADSITSDLGEPILTPSAIPISDTTGDSFIGREAKIGCDKVKLSAVGMGNPHCVIFDAKLDEASFVQRADKLQADKFFPEGVNVEFVEVVSRKHMRVVVYERGCGRTLACASGAAATVVAGVLEGKTDRDVRVELEGGSLQISWSDEDNHLRINGGASLVYEGLIQLSQIMPEAAQW